MHWWRIRKKIFSIYPQLHQYDVYIMSISCLYHVYIMSISCLYHVYVLSISCLTDNHVYIMFKVYNNVLPAGSILAHCRTEKMLHEREYSLFRRVYIRSISEAGSILSQKFCHCVASCKYVGSLQSQTAGRARTMSIPCLSHVYIISISSLNHVYIMSISCLYNVTS